MPSTVGAVARLSLNPLDRDIARLAVPAFGALVAEPLFLLTDTALVGHLGADILGGLSIASTVLQTVIGLMIFLAYATTPTVARRLGAGDRPGAIRAGIDGMWLALLLGVILLAGGLLVAEPLVAAFGSTAAVTEAGVTYLSVSLWGLPGMLLVIAATGLLRGLQDTRTPLIVALAGFAANAGLNVLFIYGFGWGIAGSAQGTVVAQWAMALVYVVMAVRSSRATGASLRPGLNGVLTAVASGGWLILRTASLRVALLITVFAATGLGVTELATLQIALTLFSTIAFMLDALAIAGQAMIGHGLGASDVGRVTAITRRLVQVGIGAGVVIGMLLAAVSWTLGPVFTSDVGVHGLLTTVVLVMAIGIPLAGYVFVLDGVLIGAGDARYLAVASLISLLLYLPLLWLALELDSGLIGVWLAFGVGYMGARALTLGVRAHGEKWIVTGAR
jgi:putative MATE family efflux protein